MNTKKRIIFFAIGIYYFLELSEATDETACNVVLLEEIKDQVKKAALKSGIADKIGIVSMTGPQTHFFHCFLPDTENPNMAARIRSIIKPTNQPRVPTVRSSTMSAIRPRTKADKNNPQPIREFSFSCSSDSGC